MRSFTQTERDKKLCIWRHSPNRYAIIPHKSFCSKLLHAKRLGDLATRRSYITFGGVVGVMDGLSAIRFAVFKKKSRNAKSGAKTGTGDLPVNSIFRRNAGELADHARWSPWSATIRYFGDTRR